MTQDSAQTTLSDSNADLAVLGGRPVVDASLHRGWPEIGEADRQAVLGVLERGVLSGPAAPEVAGLERDFAAYLGVEYCLALNSGTAALHCCCAAAGLEPGDEVIVPALTFIASAMAVCQQGATPVFCDIDPATYNIDPGLIEERITERTKAIMAVHLHGLPCDMGPIQEIADRHGLLIIEDGAQAPGATYKGQKVGSLGHTAGFSLQQTKNLSGGEGGLFVTNDEQAYRAAARLRIFGEDVPWPEAHGSRVYLSHGLGFNYRNHELSAALARSQLRRLDEYNRAGQQNAERLDSALALLGGVESMQVGPDFTCTYYLYRVRLSSADLGVDIEPVELRERVVAALIAEGVNAIVWQHWPLPAHPVFRQRTAVPWNPRHAADRLAPWDPANFPAASRLIDSSFVLISPETPLMVQDPELIDQYSTALQRIVENVEELLTLPYTPPDLPSLER